MKHVRTIFAVLLGVSLCACGTQPSQPSLNESEEETASEETTLNTSLIQDEAQPEQIPEETAEYTLSEGTVRLSIPSVGWSASVEDDRVVITPEGYEETWLNVYFDDFFAVCGTGLEQKEDTISGRRTTLGYYDGKPWWDYAAVGEFGGMQLIITKLGMHWDEKELNDTADQIIHSIVIE